MFFVSDPYKIVQLIEEKGIDLLFFQRHGRNELLHDKISNLLNEDVSVVELNIFSSKDYGDFGKKCGAHVFVSSINLLKYCRQNKILIMNKIYLHKKNAFLYTFHFYVELSDH